MLSRCPLLPLPRSTDRPHTTPQQGYEPTSSRRQLPLLLHAALPPLPPPPLPPPPLPLLLLLVVVVVSPNEGPCP
jgi:hypothetical protein